MMFGAAETLKMELSKVNHSGQRLADLIRGRTYAQAMEILDRHITHYQAVLVEQATPFKVTRGGVTTTHYVFISQTYDPRGEVECMVNLRKKGLATIVDFIEDKHRYILTGSGKELMHAIHSCRNATSKAVKPFEELVDKPSFTFIRNKLASIRTWWASARALPDLSSLVDSFKMLLESAEKIQQVSLYVKPEDIKVIPLRNTWTVEQQRELNDLYWESNGLAFWLNPNGPLADAVPVPEWWVRPVRQEVYNPSLIDDVVTQSLQAPAGYKKPSSDHSDLDDIIRLLEVDNKKSNKQNSKIKSTKDSWESHYKNGAEMAQHEMMKMKEEQQIAQIAQMKAKYAKYRREEIEYDNGGSYSSSSSDW